MGKVEIKIEGLKEVREVVEKMAKFPWGVEGSPERVTYWKKILKELEERRFR